jgi:hypothetical protein
LQRGRVGKTKRECVWKRGSGLSGTVESRNWEGLWRFPAGEARLRRRAFDSLYEKAEKEAVFSRRPHRGVELQSGLRVKRSEGSQAESPVGDRVTAEMERASRPTPHLPFVDNSLHNPLFSTMIKKVNKRSSDQTKVTFVLPEDHDMGKDVHVVGDFNNWTPGENKFVRRSNQTYSTNAMLEEGGRYEFRYYSEDKGYFDESDADDYVPNEHGGQNCVVEA